MEFAGKLVLITGGLGFIGSNLARRLVGLGARVTLIDSLIPEYGGNPYNIRDFQDKVTLNISDIRDIYSLEYLVRGSDYIFNLAGQTSHMDSMSQPHNDLQINCTAQLSLLEVARAVAPQVKIVFASTRQIYGRPQYLPVDEAHPLNPTDVNGINKIAGESYHMLYNNVYGMRATALRLTNTYGPGMRVKDARQTFLGIWINLAIQGRPFEVWGGHQLRDFSFIDDTVEAFLRAASPEVDGMALNISGDRVLSLLAVAELLRGITGTDYVVREFPEERKRIDIGDYYGDDAQFRRLTGWEPKVSIERGLNDTVTFYRSALPSYI